MERIRASFLILLSCCAGFGSCGLLTKDGAIPETNQWRLVWQEEFSKDGAPDSAKWTFAGRGKANWNCYCTDTAAVAIVRNGTLLLRGIKGKDGGEAPEYATGCISTKGKFSFRYGKLEVRARFSGGQGSWPAIWLMPQESVYGGWPQSGEIDVMEHLNKDRVVYQTLHSHYIDVAGQKKDPPYFVKASFNEGKFNIFGMEWYPGRIDFFVNGRKTFSYPRRKDAGTRQWPFDQEFYIILNQALGGSWAGKIDAGELPAEMQVDWVRVYK